METMASFPSGTLFAASALICAAAFADPTHSPSRGELLYSTHCIGCHTAQKHWRDKKQVTDWDSLEQQVRRWQAAVMLEWNEDDIHEVARHLNDSYYHFARPVER
jgi:mono/diheme cytochrome c family protein